MTTEIYHLKDYPIAEIVTILENFFETHTYKSRPSAGDEIDLEPKLKVKTKIKKTGTDDPTITIKSYGDWDSEIILEV